MTPEYLVHIVDDDDAVRDALLELLDTVAMKAIGFPSAAEFLAELNPNIAGCLVLDIRMPGMSGLELQKKTTRDGFNLAYYFYYRTCRCTDGDRGDEIRGGRIYSKTIP